MSNTQPDEIEKILDSFLVSVTGISTKPFPTQKAQAHEAITTMIREARIDELTKSYTQVIGDKDAPSSRYSKVTKIFNIYLKKRYEELSKPIDELSQEEYITAWNKEAQHHIHVPFIDQPINKGTE